MTLPNYPWGTTDPADLPQGTIIPSQAGDALQDQTQGKYTAEMASRFPDIASNTLAGSPAGGGAMGFVTQQASRIVSNIANSDPATINSPKDIVSRAGSFFQGNSIGESIINLLFRRNTSLASRVSAIEGKIATGAEFFDNFNRGDTSSTLGGGWTQGGNGQPLGIHDQAAQITVGGVIAQAGRQWAKAPTDASGDDFTVSMVTHPVQVSDTAATSLIARANAAFTEGLSVNMFRGKCYLSRWTRSGNTWTYTDVANNLSRSYSGSATVEFKGSGTSLQVIIDSVVIITATDTVHAIDSSHRSTGFTLTTTTIAGGFAPSYSAGLASYSVKSVAALQSVATTAAAVAAPIAAEAATEAVAPVATQAADASATATAAQNQVAQAISTQNASSALGVSVSAVFSGADGVALGSSWTDDGQGGIAIRNPNGYVGIKTGVADGVYGTRLSSQATATDNQSVIVVVGDSANRDQLTSLLLRCDSGLTRGAYCRFGANNASMSLGAWTRAGSAWSFGSAWTSSTVRVKPGDIVEFRCIGSTYLAFVNRILVLTYTDSGGALTVGPDYRFSGFAMQRQTITTNTGFPFFQDVTTVYDSFRIASYAASDMKAPGAIVGIGWKLLRASTGNVAAPSGAASTQYQLATDLYDTSANVSQVAVTNLPQGKITIQRAGYYQITAAFRDTGNQIYTQYVVYVNGSRATDAIANDAPTFIYLAEGDVVAPGYFRFGSAGTSFTGGNPSGGSLHFAGYLMQTAA